MANEKPDMTWIWIVVAAVVVVGFFIFHQSIAPVKTAPITLVPSGSQQAVNPNTIATNIPGGVLSTDASIAQSQAQAQSNIATANALQNAALYGAAGDFLSNLSDGIFSSDNSSN